MTWKWDVGCSSAASPRVGYRMPKGEKQVEGGVASDGRMVKHAIVGYREDSVEEFEPKPAS